MCLLACLAALVGCSDSDTESGEQAIGPIPTIRSDAAIRLPLDPYIETSETVRVVERAVHLLGRDCMRRFGLDWQVPEPPAIRRAPLHAGRYGLLDPAEAARHGYHSPPSYVPSPRPREPERTPSQIELEVWAGNGRKTVSGRSVPDGGCAGEALRALERDAPKAPAIQPQMRANEALQRAERHPRVRSAFARWSSCMRRAGYRYRSPWDVNDDQRWKTPRPSRHELATATADVDCRAETNLVGIWYAVERSYQRRYLKAHARELAAVRRTATIRAASAARVVAARADRER